MIPAPYLRRTLLGLSLAVLLSACGARPIAPAPSPSAHAHSPATPSPTTVPQSSPAASMEAAPSSAPSAAPAAQPTTAPAAEAQPAAPVAYFWPGTIPQDMHILPVESSAGPDMFVLNLGSEGSQWSATITGGSTSRAALPPPASAKPITVRGQPGAAFTTGAGYSLFWNEAGQPYAILSTLSLDDALVLAADLQPLDHTSWITKFGAATGDAR